ncbi:MAG: aldo/keto reductase [Rhodospirillaceae bacterium]|jgi:1-deoxyxylulose-5-phosphate synthase|nr:aldo/keto reductase [Rhodospirillaceae bacterium]MBT5914388.1 aldo/keto reductase [Rhodospirillaceae bacterium]MBT6305342.1 aldo/keto reductase [Rhodospirillaceae bacterium]MBT7733128.1 aldo/keto reductase [Rhodospirillaceae bacterium]MDC1442131.1 aldo/keto reductase [Rhodospirillaceae bacterium]
MKFVNLGSSGLNVSAICIGGNSWGARGRRDWAAFDQSDSAPFFRHALDNGVNFFDTADAYNLGESERIIGETLMGYASRENIVLSTKVGLRMGAGVNQIGLGRKHLMESIDKQLKRLKTDYIDLYQIHRLDNITPLEEVLDTLTEIRKAGKILYIGCSTMPAYKFAQLLTLAECKGYARPIAMQNLYNLIQRDEEREMIPLCVDAGVGLIPYSPLARGVLAGNRVGGGVGETERAKYDKGLKTGASLFRDSDKEVVATVISIAKKYDIKPTQVALSWILKNPAVVSPIIGATKLSHISDAISAVDIELSMDDMKDLERPYQSRESPLNI